MHGGFSLAEIDHLLRQVDADLAAWMAGFGGSAMGRDANGHQLQAYMATLLAMRPDIGRTLMRSIFRSDHRELLSHLSANTTIVQSADDVAVPLSVFDYLVNRTHCIGQHVLPVSGHLPHVTHPQLVAPIVHNLLVSLGGHDAGALPAEEPA
ncbi:alpha/beta fold hydrolase [Gemmatimonas sp.]